MESSVFERHSFEGLGRYLRCALYTLDLCMLVKTIILTQLTIIRRNEQLRFVTPAQTGLLENLT